jgi:hypothetical protein
VNQLLQRFPGHFSLPARVSDRKPGKGEKDTVELEFVKPEILAKMATTGQLVMCLPEAGGCQTAIKTASVEAIAAAGEPHTLLKGTGYGVPKECRAGC